MKFSYISLLILVTLITIVTYRPKSIYASTVYFSDDFEDGDISDWIPTNNSCGSTWGIQNRNGSNKLGIVINGDCFTEIAPNYWNPNVNDYLLEVDMEFVSGMDKNLAFRFTNHSDWYDLHFITNKPNNQPSEIVLQHVYNWQQYPNRTNVEGMSNGNTYHIGVKIIGEHIQIYVDNNLVLDYPDAGGRFPNGGIALQASAGGDPHSEVYFDNVLVSSIDSEPTPTPTPTPTPAPEPIVILPGMMASWCPQAIITGADCPGDWTALPEPLDPYDSLISSITNAADIPDENVFVWYYDWRHRINDLSGQLNTYINSTVLSGQPAGTKVKLVGHSYGGLVAADYSQDHPDKVGKLITAGSPHRGTVDAYGAWEGGQLWNLPAWQRTVVRLLFSARGGLFPSLKDTVRNDIPSVQELLPTFDYLTNQNNQTISESSLNQRNPQLPSQYSALSNISSLLTTLTGLENVSADTLSSIKVKTRSWIDQALGLWEDGAPDQFSYSTQGDTTVLRTSGRYDNAASKPEVTATHVGLISETSGINAILAALGSSASAQITDSLMDDSRDYTLIFLRSPATVSVTAAGQTYSDADGDGLIILDDSVTGAATITLTGTGTGQYHLDILGLGPGGDSSQTFTGEIETGEVVVLPVNLAPSDNQPDDLDDSTGEKTLDFAQNSIDEMISDLSAAAGRARSKQILVSGINRIKTGITKAQTQINQPAKYAKTVQAALLSLHHFRSSLNSYDQAGQIDDASSAKLRSKSQNTINFLQSAFSILSSRAGKSYPSRQLNSLSTLVSRQTSIVEQRALLSDLSSLNSLIAAVAANAAAADQAQADSAKNSNPPTAYINYISSQMYLQESLSSLR